MQQISNKHRLLYLILFADTGIGSPESDREIRSEASVSCGGDAAGLEEKAMGEDICVPSDLKP